MKVPHGKADIEVMCVVCGHRTAQIWARRCAEGADSECLLRETLREKQGERLEAETVQKQCNYLDILMLLSVYTVMC